MYLLPMWSSSALASWAQSEQGYPLLWQALWPLLGLALERDEVGEAIDHAGVMLRPDQQVLPDAIAGPLAAGLAQRGIATGVHFRRNDLHAIFGPARDLPGAEAYWTRTLSLPVHLALTDDQVETTLPKRTPENTPPIANNDEFGVRPGRTTMLPVLDNDTDADGDVLVASLAVIAAALLGFIKIADEMTEGEAHVFDMAVLQALHPDAANPSDPIGPFWLDHAAIDLTALGSVSVLAAISLLVGGFLVLQRRRLEAAIIAVAFGGGLAIVIVFFFLRNPRSTFISSLVLPTSVINPLILPMISA